MPVTVSDCQHNCVQALAIYWLLRFMCTVYDKEFICCYHVVMMRSRGQLLLLVLLRTARCNQSSRSAERQ